MVRIIFTTYLCIVCLLALRKEEVGDEDGGNDASEVGQQTAADGVARVADADGTEVNGEDIEGGVGGTLENTAETAHEGIGTVSLHGVDHHAAGPAAAEGFHEGCREGTDPVVGQTGMAKAPRHAVDEPVHRTRSAKHADAHQHGNEVGNDADGGGEPFFGTFNEGIVDVDTAQHAGRQKSDDDGEEQNVGSGGADGVHHRPVEPREAPHDGGHQQGEATEGEEKGAVEEVDTLINTRDDDAGERGTERGEENRNEDIGGLRSPHLGTIDQDADRNDGEAGGVEHEKHDHRIRGRVFFLIELLQSFHSLQPQGGRGVVEPEHIGGDVHEDVAHHGVSLRNVGEEFGKDGAEQARKGTDHPTLLADFHHAEPKGKHASETEGDFKSGLRCLEGGVHDGRKHGDIAHKDELDEGDDEGHSKECNPDIIKYHEM